MAPRLPVSPLLLTGPSNPFVASSGEKGTVKINFYLYIAMNIMQREYFSKQKLIISLYHSFVQLLRKKIKKVIPSKANIQKHL